ncbi:MAG: hypothetical protein AAFX02_00770 [Pseudomonadota bacterium]
MSQVNRQIILYLKAFFAGFLPSLILWATGSYALIMITIGIKLGDALAFGIGCLIAVFPLVMILRRVRRERRDRAVVSEFD